MKASHITQKAAIQHENQLLGISRVAIQGYKSVANQCSIDLGYLTVLAGANSAGKSSLFQPLLILKQTLESPFSLSSLLINGESVKITSLEQLLPCISNQPKHRNLDRELIVEIELSSRKSVRLRFSNKSRAKERRLKIIESSYRNLQKNKEFSLDQNSSREYIIDLVKELFEGHPPVGLLEVFQNSPINPMIEGSCFLDLGTSDQNLSISLSLFADYAKALRRIIHVSGIRGNPERAYQRTAIGPEFKGTFDKYVASIILAWQTEKKAQISQLSKDLAELGLTSTISANEVNDAQIELIIGRCLSNKTRRAGTTVNIADVGFGVSQVLPVLVALLVAEPGQLVYIEQPEIHLHPKAQVALADVLIRAALRKVRVVVETHSSILLLAIQTRVAEGKLPPSDTYLHWVSRDTEGITEVSSQQLDEAGAFGDWPEDFGDTLLNLESRYLNAVDAKDFG